MSLLQGLDWSAVKEHYEVRERTHKRLLDLYGSKNRAKFCGLALGIDHRSGNYSANEYKTGPKILGSNRDAERRVFDLATEFLKLKSAASVPEIIRRAGIKHLAIGVGSEFSCMINPKVCWVANTRTIWTDLIIKHHDNVEKANEELLLYRQADTQFRDGISPVVCNTRGVRGSDDTYRRGGQRTGHP